MKRVFPIIITGFLSIVLLDSIGSIASRQLNFNYGYLLPFSVAIYIAFPFIIARSVNRKIAIISAGLLGFFDATIGWKLSMLLQANTGSSKFDLTPTLIIATIVFVTLFSILMGLSGSWLASKSVGKKPK